MSARMENNFVIFLHMQDFLEKRRDNVYNYVPFSFAYNVHCSHNKSNAMFYEEFTSYIGENCVEEFWNKIENTGNKLTEKIMGPESNKKSPNFVLVLDYKYHLNLQMLLNKLPAHVSTSNFEQTKRKIIQSVKVNFNKFSINFENFFLLFGYRIDEIKIKIPTIEGNGKDIQDLKSSYMELLPFPFAFVKSIADLEHCGCLDKDDFYNIISEDELSDEEFLNVQRVWEEAMTVREYLLIFLKSNVTCLQDSFQFYRELCFKGFNADILGSKPAYFCYDTMLKYTQHAVVQLPSDMNKFFYKNFTYPVSTLGSKRVANNSDSFITVFHAKHALKWAMSQYLPHSDFSWLNFSEIASLKCDLETIPENNEFGYILEVDLQYPKSLHDLHNDLPFCCKATFLNLKLENKVRHVIHYRHLQLCLKHGLILQKIHKALKFKQEKWLQPYVLRNIELQNACSNTLELDFYNFFFDKMSYLSLTKIIKSTGQLGYLSFTVFELHKYFIYDFHYSHMLAKYKDKCTLLCLDVDSFFYEIETKDFYKDLEDDQDFKSLFISTDNNFISIDELTQIEDKANGKIVSEFYGVRNDVYCYVIDGKEVKKAVYIRKYLKDKYISKNDYKNSIEMNKNVVKSMWVDQNVNDYGILIEKKSTKILEPNNAKRYYSNADNIRGLAIGHYRIPLSVTLRGPFLPTRPKRY